MATVEICETGGSRRNRVRKSCEEARLISTSMGMQGVMGGRSHRRDYLPDITERTNGAKCNHNVGFRFESRFKMRNMGTKEEGEDG